jgi:putative membrane protein
MTELFRWALHFLLSGLSVLLVSALLPGMRVRKYADAVWFSIVVAVLNVVVWRVLGAVTIPLGVLTLGIAVVALNGVVFLVAKNVVRGIEIDGCLIASIASILVTIVNALLRWALF